MDSDLNSENLCQSEGTVANTIGSSIEERKQEVLVGVVDPVSEGCANDIEMSALASSGCDGDMISFGQCCGSCFDEKEGIVESELDFSSGCENSTLDFSDVKGNKEMAGTMLVSEVNGEEAEIFKAFSVFKEGKYYGVCETSESSSEVQLQTVYGHEDKQLDNFMDAEENQVEVESIIGSTHKSQNSVEKRNSVNPEIVSIAEAQSHGIKMFSSDHDGGVTRDSSEIQDILSLSKTVWMVEVQNADGRLSSRGGCGSCTSEITELQDIVESNPDKRSILEKSEDPVENCLQSNVGHCPSFVSEAGTGSRRKEREFAASDKKRTGSSSVDTKQEMAGKKEKRSKRRTKSTKKVSEINGNGNFCLKKRIGSKRIYSRKEMEALRYVNVEEQQNMWNKVYLGLGAAVARELDNMADSKPQNQDHKNFNHHQSFGKKKQSGPMIREECFQIVDHNFEGHISGKAGPQNLTDNLEEANSLYIACDDPADGLYGDCTLVECDEDSASDDENDSNQKPAFLVEGDPNFESGPPEDGLEYLRRARWEAKHIPKVKVATVDTNKICNEQTVYMPDMPDIVKCPEHLIPSKEWEDAFLADFLELRLTMSQLESSEQKNTGNLQPHLSFIGDDSCSSDLKLSDVLGMDHVSRALKLKNCIRSLESECSA